MLSIATAVLLAACFRGWHSHAKVPPMDEKDLHARLVANIHGEPLPIKRQRPLRLHVRFNSLSPSKENATGPRRARA